jgi:hypothetical protein
MAETSESVPEPQFGASGAVDPLPVALVGHLSAKKIVAYLKRLGFVGLISPMELALLVPRGIALAELNLTREQPLTDADLTRALNELDITDYPQRATPLSGGLKPYVWPDDRNNPQHGLKLDGSTPGALQGDDYPLEYDADGYPILPACLDRRKPKLEIAA